MDPPLHLHLNIQTLYQYHWLYCCFRLFYDCMYFIVLYKCYLINYGFSQDDSDKLTNWFRISFPINNNCVRIGVKRCLLPFLLNTSWNPNRTAHNLSPTLFPRTNDNINIVDKPPHLMWTPNACIACRWLQTRDELFVRILECFLSPVWVHVRVIGKIKHVACRWFSRDSKTGWRVFSYWLYYRWMVLRPHRLTVALQSFREWGLSG